MLTFTGFEKSKVDTGLWSNKIALVVLWSYVDDILTAGPDGATLDPTFAQLGNIFKIKGLGRPARILGIEISYFPDGVLLHQREYAAKISHRCTEAKTVPIQCKLEVSQEEVQLGKEDHDLYRKIVGSLLWWYQRDQIRRTYHLCLEDMSQGQHSHVWKQHAGQWNTWMKHILLD